MKWMAWIVVGVLGWVGLVAADRFDPAVEVAARRAVRMADRLAPDAELVRAVRERLVVRFYYNGQFRVGEPHAYGVASNGEELLLLFQTGGGSATRAPLGWRRFSVAKILGLEVMAERFAGARLGFSAENPRLEPLWAVVEQ